MPDAPTPMPPDGSAASDADTMPQERYVPRFWSWLDLAAAHCPPDQYLRERFRSAFVREHIPGLLGAYITDRRLKADFLEWLFEGEDDQPKTITAIRVEFDPDGSVRGQDGEFIDWEHELYRRDKPSFPPTALNPPASSR